MTRLTKKARVAPRRGEIAKASDTWRANGGPLTKDGPDRWEREKGQIALAMSLLGVDVHDASKLLRVPKGNDVYNGLFLMKMMVSNKVINAALDEMSRLGLDGPDWRERLAFLAAENPPEIPDLTALKVLADVPDAIVDRMTAETVEINKLSGMSERAAMDTAAVQWNVPASGNIPRSGDGMEAPRQEVKRRLKRSRERAGKGVQCDETDGAGVCATSALKQPRVSRMHRRPSKVD